MKVENMTNKQLLAELIAESETINNDCFGTSDLINLRLIEREIERRGLKVVTKTKYSLKKAD